MTLMVLFFRSELFHLKFTIIFLGRTKHRAAERGVQGGIKGVFEGLQIIQQFLRHTV